MLWIRIVLLLLAVICFVLAVFKVTLPVELIPLGLALGFAAFLPWWS
jgi:hypothetical protein